jgi:hypothetical protein
MEHPVTNLSVEDVPDAMFIDLAIGVNDFADICENYGIDETTAMYLSTTEHFKRRVRIAEAVVADDGTAFKARCRLAVTNTVDHVLNLVRDPAVPSTTQLDAFKTLAKFGELEPVRDANAGSMGPMLTLNIVAPDGSSGMTLQTAAREPREVKGVVTMDVPELSIAEPVKSRRATSLFGAS